MMLDRYSSYAFQRYAITDVTSYNVRRNDRSIEARVTEFLIFESNVPTLTSSRVFDICFKVITIFLQIYIFFVICYFSIKSRYCL